MSVRVVAILAVMALMLPVPATTFAEAPQTNLISADCGAQQSAMASLGRPSAQAILLAKRPAHWVPVAQPTWQVYVVRPGDTLSALAQRYRTTVTAIAAQNGVSNRDLIYVGQRLVIPGAVESVPFVAASLSPPLSAAWLDAEVVQGDTAIIWLRAAPGTSVTGQRGSQTVHFHARCDLLWGLVAFDALNDEPGVHRLRLDVRSADGQATVASLPIPVGAGNFSTAHINFPPDKQRLLDPDLIRSENQQLNDLFAALPASGPQWPGPFQLPLSKVRVTNGFGGRTVFSNGRGTVYHEGIDYGAPTGTPIHAVAPGTVLLAEALTVRGNTVYLDHGAGVVTGYFHMSEIDVTPGDAVQAGDLIGKIGSTGLSTGPHLHWEVRVNGRWVNPVPWLQRSFP